MCKEQRSQSATASARRVTVDVFDLVLPLLYPPIGPNAPLAVVFPVPKKPYPFQYDGIRFLSERAGALLGDEMGLGKTIQAIVAMRMLVRQGTVRQSLILCPRSMLGTWEKELREWAPELSLQRVRGTIDERKHLWSSAAHVMLTTYETLRNDMARRSELGSKFDLVILDEIQRIKNRSTKLARACHRLQASHRWGLSGTPLENSLDDVVSIYSYLKPGLFNGQHEFYWSSMVKETIRPHFLRRRTADVLDDLPEKVTEDIWLDLTKQQRAAYQRAQQSGVDDLRQRKVTRVHVFALINELKQICNWEPVSETSCKLEYLTDQLDLIASSQEKALVFSHYPNKSLVQIMPKLHSFAPAMFDGSMSDVVRETLIRGFMHEETPRVLLASVKAGGVGLTLTRANHVFHFDHWWNPAVANQATGRAHRIGQTRTVFEYHLYTRDTIEERIHGLLREKQRLFDNVIDDISEEEFSRRISDEELFGLFDLKPPTGSGRARQSTAPTPSRVSTPPKEPLRSQSLQIRTADVPLDPPEKITQEIWLNLTVQQSASYRRAQQRGVAVLRRPSATRVHVSSLINELKQICNWEPVSGTSCKFDYLMDWLDIINPDEKALVFSHCSTRTLKELQPKLHRHAAEFIDGSMSDARKESVIASFEHQASPRILLVSVTAGDVGVTLTRANHVFHLDYWWSPAVASQATSWVHRIGQTRTVFEYHLYTTGTIEERIYKLLRARPQLHDNVIDGISEEDVTRRISNEDLFRLFDLKPPTATSRMAQSSRPAFSRAPTPTIGAALPGSSIPDKSGRQATSEPASRQNRTRAVSPARRKGQGPEALAHLSPDEFRRVVASYYEKRGFDVGSVRNPNDGETYLVARRSSQVNAEHCIVVMCRSDTELDVTDSAVQNLYSVSRDSPMVTGLAIVSSAALGVYVRTLAALDNIELIDGETLHKELVRVGLL